MSRLAGLRPASPLGSSGLEGPAGCGPLVARWWASMGQRAFSWEFRLPSGSVWPPTVVEHSFFSAYN